MEWNGCRGEDVHIGLVGWWPSSKHRGVRSGKEKLLLENSKRLELKRQNSSKTRCLGGVEAHGMYHGDRRSLVHARGVLFEGGQDDALQFWQAQAPLAFGVLLSTLLYMSSFDGGRGG